jgi:hypothetical protein
MNESNPPAKKPLAFWLWVIVPVAAVGLVSVIGIVCLVYAYRRPNPDKLTQAKNDPPLPMKKEKPPWLKSEKPGPVIEPKFEKPGVKPTPVYEGGTKDQDYFRILEAKFERTAFLAMAQKWSRDYPDAFPPTVAHSAVRRVIDAANAAAENAQRTDEQRQKDFIEYHNADYSTWEPTFKAQFPEHAAVHEKIKAEVQSLVPVQMALVQKDLTGKWTDTKVCDRYFFDKTPKFLDETRALLKKSESIQNLRAKFFPGAN